MTTPTPGVAGWFSDPAGRHEHRWWDGASWTDQVATGGANAVDPLTGPSSPEPPGPPPPPDYTGAQPTAAFGSPAVSGGYDPPPPPPGGFGSPPPAPGSDPTVAFGAPPAPAAFGAPPPPPVPFSGAPTGAYGAPTGGYGTPPPAAPAGGSSKVPFIVAGVLVVAALIAGIVLFTGGDDDDNDDDVAIGNDDDEEAGDEGDEEEDPAEEGDGGSDDEGIPGEPGASEDTTDTTEQGDESGDTGGGGNDVPAVLGEETASGEIVADVAEVDVSDLSIIGGTAVVIRVAPEEDFDAAVSILGDDAQLATFSDFATALGQAYETDPASADAPAGVSDAVSNFGFALSGAPTADLLASDAAATDPTPLLPVVLFEEDPGSSGTAELFVLFAPEDVELQLVITGFLGDQGTFDAGVTFVELGTAPDPASFAAAVATSPELAALIG